MALVIGLQPGEHQIEVLVLHRRGQSLGDDKRVRSAKRIVLDVNRAVGAAGERLADDRLHAGGAGRADDNLAAVFLPKPQRLFERVGIGLVHLVADVLFANPRL